MRVPMEWIGADLSASTYTKWIPVTPQTKKITVTIGWTATGTPVGTLAIEFSDHGKLGVAGDAYSVAITPQPAGAANHIIGYNATPTARTIRMTYTAGSGGTGAVFTDDTQVAGTTPSIQFWE